MKMRLKNFIFVFTCTLASSVTSATPSSNLWANSTASCQAYGIPHVTYDTYFNRGPTVGTAGARGYPIDTGLTVGFLPFEKIQGEIGFDMLLPSEDPLLLNGKICTPESALFNGSPGVGVGIYNVGFKKDVNDYNILYLIFQKSLPGGKGYVSLGAYHGLNKDLFINSQGKHEQTGLIAGITSPDISLDFKGLKKINFVADIQTGKSAFGAWSIGPYFYFTDSIALGIAPVFFFDRDVQPGKSNLMWTAQVDIDFPLSK